MSDKKILVSTFGDSWQIVPELVGFTNPETLDLYKNSDNYENIMKKREENNIEPIDELWLITTAGNSKIEKIKDLKEKVEKFPKLKFFVSENIKDITSNDECIQFGDLIYRVVNAAKNLTGSGKLFLSLTGGRKTMSVDMQKAGNIFGCDAMLHVIDKGITKEFREADIDVFSKPLNKEFANILTPIIISSKIEKQYYFNFENIDKKFYEISLNDEKNLIEESSEFYNYIEENIKKANYLMANYKELIYEEKTLPNFRALYFLPPVKINLLKEIKFGVDITKKEKELGFLKLLPKADLHCHFGGIADINEIIQIAEANIDEINYYKKNNKNYESFLNNIAEIVEKGDLEKLKKEYGDHKKLRKFINDVPEPYNLAGFIYQFKGNPEMLDEFIFGEYRNEEKYFGINIDKYEKLGDFQGSGLFQSKNSIIKGCEILRQKAEEENIRYIELRCSPVNYTRGGLNELEVLELIINELNKSTKCRFEFIIIGSRHGKMSDIYKHIELVENYLTKNTEKKIVGFDLAGNETAREASMIREAFLNIMEKCIRITIHAGETDTVDSIWQAIYHLNADRIGHGLKLKENPDLMNRIRDRKIAIEMCPSSNFQIVGYKDNYFPNLSTNNFYPLKDYLYNGLKVTINTDNMGISRTNLTNEYLKAARMSEKGLSLWEILVIIRNGFSNSFLNYEDRNKLIKEVEKEIIQLIENKGLEI